MKKRKNKRKLFDSNNKKKRVKRWDEKMMTTKKWSTNMIENTNALLLGTRKREKTMRRMKRDEEDA